MVGRPAGRAAHRPATELRDALSSRRAAQPLPPRTVSIGSTPCAASPSSGWRCFHFAFDLNHFGFIRQNFYTDPVWTVQRTCIVSLFLFCAGLGQAVALAAGPGLAALLAPLGAGGGLRGAGQRRLVR